MFNFYDVTPGKTYDKKNLYYRNLKWHQCICNAGIIIYIVLICRCIMGTITMYKSSLLKDEYFYRGYFCNLYFTKHLHGGSFFEELENIIYSTGMRFLRLFDLLVINFVNKT